ncbi:MAG TPA: glycosyltransferase [Deltaproteobacteria bacterium]|nr:glycosyltransferase [Deltaproteobacteria bacterium]
MKTDALNIAMFSIHSSPIGELGTRDTGGMSVYIRELAQELGKHGHRVDIYTRNNHNNPPAVMYLNDHVRLVHLDIGENGHLSKHTLYPVLEDFFKALEVFRNKDDRQYDIIHSHYWLSGRLGHWAQELWNRPHIVMFHTLGAIKNLTGVGLPEPEIRITNEKSLARSCNRILVPTEREKELLVDHYDAFPGKIGVVPCGVNLNLFQPVDRSVARRQLGFEQNESMILYVGRFDPVKGLDRLLEALTHLRDYRIRLVIVGGDGPETEDAQTLMRLSQKWGVQDIVTFEGRITQENLPPYYSAADVLVVPSHYESFGLVGLESLACGTPVVSTKVGVLDRLLQDGMNGSIVPNGCPKALALSIETFINGTSLKDSTSEVIRTSVEDYSWSNVATAIIDEYKAVCNQNLIPPAPNISGK